MSQSRLHSFVEAWTGTIVGFAVSLAMSPIVYPMFGHSFTLIENIWIVLIFTVISVVRGYGVRRFFVWWHRRKG